ncbi:MAG: outer membrane beta-barrel family protein [Tannerellaceae bacterium]|nr:outer membrane beta-barrel family protein [Tannerellaceae bacterium]
MSNSLQGQNDQTTWNYGVGGSTTIYLPYEFRIESDITYSANSGYSDGYEQKETLWNASASKSFLKGNQAMVRFRIFDILQKRSNTSRTVTASYIRDSEYNTLNSYFIVQFIYRFTIFAGGGSRRDMPGGRRGPGGDGGRRGMGERGGPPPGF